MAGTLSVDSVSSFALQNTDRPDMNLATQSKRILFVLDQTISRAKFVGVLKSLVADDGFLLSNILDSEEHFYVVQICRNSGINLLMLFLPLYTSQVLDRVISSESVSTLVMLTIITLSAFACSAMLETCRYLAMAKIGDWIDKTATPFKYLINITKSIFALYEFTGVKFTHKKDSTAESTVVSEKKTPTSSQSAKTSTTSSETGEESSESSFLESSIHEMKPPKMQNRVDSELSKLILMLEKNPRVHKLVAEIQNEISPQMRFFIKCMKELREGIALHLGESAEEEKKREAYLRECYLKNEKAKKEIARLEQELLEHKMDKNYCIIGRNVLINRHQNKINKIKQSSAEAIDKKVKESERAMANDWKNSVALQDKLKEELQASTSKYEKLLRDNLAAEKILRAKRVKLENQLIGWLQKFDQDIGEKQAEEEEIQALLDEQNVELENIRMKLEEQEEEYDELMQEKAEYELELLEQRLYIFILNRSARRIQRYFRAYKAKKLAKKKEKDRRGKKGGKKK